MDETILVNDRRHRWEGADKLKSAENPSAPYQIPIVDLDRLPVTDLGQPLETAPVAPPVLLAELISHLLAIVKEYPATALMPVALASDEEGNAFHYLQPITPGQPGGVTLDPEETQNPCVTLWPGREAL